MCQAVPRRLDFSTRSLGQVMILPVELYIVNFTSHYDCCIVSLITVNKRTVLYLHSSSQSAMFYVL